MMLTPAEFPYKSFKKFFNRKQNTKTSDDYKKIKATSTGTIVSPDGIVLAANHAVGPNESPAILFNGKTYPAKVLKRLPLLDVMILKVKTEKQGFPYSPVADSRSLKLGDPLFLIGYPNPAIQGQFPKLTKTYYSASKGFNADKKMFQISADQASGSSGSGVFDKNGHLVGVFLLKLVGFDSPPVLIPNDVSYCSKSCYFLKDLEPYFTGDIADRAIKPKTESENIENVAKTSVLVMSYGKGESESD
jgi:S1-C subfamily serine protease